MTKKKEPAGKKRVIDSKDLLSELDAWREKLKFLSEALESTSQPFGAGSPEGSTVIFNEAFCHLTGYTREELYDINWATDLTTPDSRAGELKALEVLDRTHEPQRYEKCYKRKDGAIIPIELLAHVALDTQGKILFYYSFITDISERKQKEEKMQWISRAYRMLSTCKEAMIRASDEPALLNDICKVIIDVGGYRLAWIGYIEDDKMRTVRPVARAGYDEGYVDATNIALNDPIRGNGPTGISLKTGKPYGSRNIQADGMMQPWRREALKRGYLSTLNLPIMDEQQIYGTLVIYSGVVGSFGDEELGLLQDLADNLAYGVKAIRDRKGRDKAEEELLRARDELGNRVLERTAELIEKQEELEVQAEELRANNEELEEQIQERKRAEANLLRSETLLAKSQEMAHIGSWEMDLATGHINRSAESYRIFGMEPGKAEINQREFIDFILPKDRELVTNALRSSEKTGENYDITYSIRRVDGEIRILLSHGEPVKDGSGRVIKMYGTNQDITERVRAEEAARASDIRFRSLIQNASDIIRIIDKDGRIIYDSLSSEKILGYPPGYMLGKSPMEFMHPDDMARMEKELSEVYESINPGTTSEFRIRKANGDYLDVESIGVNMIGVPGVDGIVVTTRPITERKRAEKELLDAKMQAELYLDLMGHDISNMHQVAIGQLELAKDIIKMNGKLEAENEEMIDASLGSLWRSAKLIDNVRKLQKIRSEEVKNKEICLDEMLVGIVNQYDGLYPEKVIKIDANECPHIVKANELLRDVFTNLLGNAIKHSKGSNIDILVKTEDAQKDGKKHYKISIEDNGPGIPDDMKDKIFNRLQRGETKARGMGLGLFLVRSLVESYKGKVWVEDRIQGNYTKGSRFVVMLPAIVE